MSYGRPTFDMSREEGALPPVKLDPRYDDPKLYTVRINTKPLMGEQAEKTNEALAGLRNLFA